MARTEIHTAIDKLRDLLLGHTRSFHGAKRPLLLLSPVIDEMKILGVAIKGVRSHIPYKSDARA
jgi:hypothetical protein